VTTKPLATVTGTMLAPGVSRNNRLYTKETIGRAVARMKTRLSDPDGLPIVMRTHHEAGDDSRLIVGRITSVDQDESGKANYAAELYNNSAGKDIAALVTPEQPALRSVSIHGYWLGNVEKFRQGGAMVETGDDLEIDAVDFTASPGVTGATVAAASYTSPPRESADGRTAISESVDATLTPTIVETEPASLQYIGEGYNTAQRNQMAAAGQAMDDGSYPIKTKGDLRRAIRAVGRGGADHDAIRAHIVKRAAALGLSAMIPPNWNKDGSMTESAPAQGVAEAYVTVCVGGDQGNIVQVCVDNADEDSLKKAAKKAAKLACNFLGDDSGDGNFNITINPDTAMDDDQDSSESVNVTIGGRRLSESETRAFLVRHAQTSSQALETAHAATATEHNTTETESAVSETATPAAETAAPALTDDLITKLGAVIGAAVKEAVASIPTAKVKESKDKKDGKAETSESTEQSAEGKQKAGKHRSLKEGVTEADLQAALVAERSRIKDELRDELIKEGTLPSRKGFRHVNESDESEKLTGDDLWNQRKQIFAANAPGLFFGTEIGAQADEQPAA
jgi:hypothetical protein